MTSRFEGREQEPEKEEGILDSLDSFDEDGKVLADVYLRQLESSEERERALLYGPALPRKEALAIADEVLTKLKRTLNAYDKLIPIYGEGVNDFFSSRYQKSYKQLSLPSRVEFSKELGVKSESYIEMFQLIYFEIGVANIYSGLLNLLTIYANERPFDVDIFMTRKLLQKLINLQAKGIRMGRRLARIQKKYKIPFLN